MSAARLRQAAELMRREDDPFFDAVADRLSQDADQLEQHLPAWQHGHERGDIASVEDTVQHHYGLALAVADTYLAAGEATTHTERTT